jgi:hypothetical protein
MKKYVVSSDQYENFKEGIKRDVPAFAVNTILAPIALLALMLMFALFVYYAFGKTSDWGLIPKMFVGIGEPIIILLALINKDFGNKLFLLWYGLFWTILGVGIFGGLTYFVLIDYLKTYFI